MLAWVKHIADARTQMILHLFVAVAATPMPVHYAAVGSGASPAATAVLAGVKGLDGKDIADTGSPSADWSPTPLDQLGASMLDSVTKKALRQDRDWEGSWCSDQGVLMVFRMSLVVPNRARHVPCSGNR